MQQKNVCPRMLWSLTFDKSERVEFFSQEVQYQIKVLTTRSFIHHEKRKTQKWV